MIFQSFKFNSTIRWLKKFQQIKHFSVRIGCASGFWGDTSIAAPQLINYGKLDFIVFDYLSEITMSLLVKAKSLDNTKGFTPDFLSISKYAKDIKSKNLKIIANAGGINPQSCAEQLKMAFDKVGVDLKIAVVKGDNLFSEENALSRPNFEDIPQSALSSNVYLGALPIKVALDHGADIVITGRCADSALVLGPLWHKFNWNFDQYNKLALGSLAGHLIECGAQVTGGIFTDHHLVPDWWKIGFPIVEVDNKSDSILVTKPPGTGGLVSRGTVAEQMVYEIGDPNNYILPDVVCDFHDVEIEESEDNVVLVKGVVGKPPTKTLKVSSTYLDKYRLTGVALIVGSGAVDKGYRTANEIIKRVRYILNKLNLADFDRVKIQVLGAEESYGAMKNELVVQQCREATIWIAAEHSNKIALQILASEIASAGTGMAPGLTGLVGGRPKVTPVIKLHSSLLDRSIPKVSVLMDGTEIQIPTMESHSYSDIPVYDESYCDNKISNKDKQKYKLSELVWARSGDKGDDCNIGVVARNDAAWAIIRERLTVEVIIRTFQHFMSSPGKVERYEMPGIKALNFVLRNSLGGGGLSSMNIDPQGKAYAQILLDQTI